MSVHTFIFPWTRLMQMWLQSDQIYCTDTSSAWDEITVQGIQLYTVTSHQDGPQGPKGTRADLHAHIYMRTCYTSNEGLRYLKGDLVYV